MEPVVEKLDFVDKLRRLLDDQLDVSRQMLSSDRVFYDFMVGIVHLHEECKKFFQFPTDFMNYSVMVMKRIGGYVILMVSKNSMDCLMYYLTEDGLFYYKGKNIRLFRADEGVGTLRFMSDGKKFTINRIGVVEESD